MPVVSRRRQRMGDARLALIVVMVAFFLGMLVGRASAFEISDNFNPPDDANVQISGKSFKQLKALKKLVCRDIMPSVWQKFPDTYDEACT